MLEKYDKTTLQAGSYAYPFSIELSENIPGSFESKDHEAKIEYKLAAYFMNYV
jgi:Arrestin (or S-antigen), N-terminal domain